MATKSLMQLLKYVIAAGQTLKYCSNFSSKAMPFLSSATAAKLGVASTFILGAAVGNQVKKQWERFPRIATEERRRLHAGADEIHKKLAAKNECDIINRIYSTLQCQSTVKNSDDSVANHYIEKAIKLCHTYLSSRGFIEMSADIALEKWIEESDWIDNTDYWPKLPSLRNYERPPYSSTLLAGVNALWKLSCLERVSIDGDLLRTFHRIVEGTYSPATPLVLKILANILCNLDDQQIFYNTGLIEVLKSYSESSEPELFLPAWRGLHNLKEVAEISTNREIYVEGVYPLNPPYVNKADTPVLDIILIHGIRGRASWTWRQHDKQKFKPILSQDQRRNLLKGQQDIDVDALYTCCWPLDWLVSSLEVPVRILAVEYTADWQISMDKCAQEACGKTISHHAKDIQKSLKKARVGDRPIIWISHSMGGLILKNMLVNDIQGEEIENKSDIPKSASVLQENISTVNRLAKQSKGIVFFSVPHHGSPLATKISQPFIYQLFSPSSEVCEMREDSLVLSELHRSFVEVTKNYGTAILTLNESKPMRNDLLGLNFHFVPSTHADPGIGRFFEVDASHVDICKPMSRLSDTYQKVAAFFQDVIKNM